MICTTLAEATLTRLNAAVAAGLADNRSRAIDLLVNEALDYRERRQEQRGQQPAERELLTILKQVVEAGLQLPAGDALCFDFELPESAPVTIAVKVTRQR